MILTSSSCPGDPHDALSQGEVSRKQRWGSVGYTCNGQNKLLTHATVDVSWQKSRKTGKIQSVGQGSRGKYLNRIPLQHSAG